jgi:L-arabinonolactonase
MASSELEATLLVDCQNLLGEGVMWNAEHARVYWTDVYGLALYSCSADGSDLVKRGLPEPLGSFAFDPNNDLIAAFASGLFRYELATGQRERLTRFETHLPRTRMNDGRCDPLGRFVVGGCHQGYRHPVSSVIAYDGQEVRTIIDGVALTNGIAFSTSGARMYFTDSETRVYHYYDYDATSGALGARHVFTTIPDTDGFADGAAVDADDNLWSARYYGGLVQQYRPDGSEGLRVRVPAECVACVCFGGEGYDQLFITTGKKDVKRERGAAQPHAGGLFTLQVAARGLPERRFRQRLF